jgi:hypothetical protein
MIISIVRHVSELPGFERNIRHRAFHVHKAPWNVHIWSFCWIMTSRPSDSLLYEMLLRWSPRYKSQFCWILSPARALHRGTNLLYEAQPVDKRMPAGTTCPDPPPRP